MGFLRFDDPGKVVEVSSGRDMGNPHREKGRRMDHAGHPSRKEEIMPRKRVPHR
jgi:hypothetical protein